MEFREAETHLEIWGRECRESSTALGMPVMSGIAEMIEHVRRQDREAKKRHKRRIRELRKAWREGDDPIDPKLVAEELGYAEPDLTAIGKQTRASVRLSSLRISSVSLRVDAVVATLPNWAKKCVDRSYRFGQPDRFAARQLRMPVSEFTRRRQASVEIVAEKLDQRYSASVGRTA